MSPALIVVLVLGAAVVGAVVGGVVSGAVTGRTARSARAAESAQAAQLLESREAIAALQARFDALAATPGSRRSTDYLITTMADEASAPAAGPGSVALSGREFTSVAVSESVVRVASLAHGVRRALSPGARARIRFEMRQELKRTRRQRRLDLRAARRRLRTQGEPTAARDRDAA